jgi:DNA-binding transcriptional ArsR family regulator
MTDNGVRKHDPTHLEKLHRLCSLEQALVDALNQPTVSLHLTKVRKKGLLAALRRAQVA